MDVSRGAYEQSIRGLRFDGPSHDFELEIKARTKHRTQCDEKRERGSEHRRKEFGEQYNSFPPGSFPDFREAQ